MKTQADLLKGWLLKAESDLTNARICFYDNEFWPSKEIVDQALDATVKIRNFVSGRLPEEMKI
jgi:hypothetical protein